jgi:hypothetical protein
VVLCLADERKKKIPKNKSRQREPSEGATDRAERGRHGHGAGRRSFASPRLTSSFHPQRPRHPRAPGLQQRLRALPSVSVSYTAVCVSPVVVRSTVSRFRVAVIADVPWRASATVDYIITVAAAGSGVKQEQASASISKQQQTAANSSKQQTAASSKQQQAANSSKQQTSSNRHQHLQSGTGQVQHSCSAVQEAFLSAGAAGDNGESIKLSAVHRTTANTPGQCLLFLME